MPRLSIRYIVPVLLVSGSLYFLCSLLFFRLDTKAAFFGHGKTERKAPTYEKTKELVRNLPQHNLDLPFPEGKTGLYLKFSNQIGFLGWNNVLAEMLLSAHLAYECKRAYVFQDYIWAPEHYPFKPTSSKPIITPVNALLSGPIVGGPWEEGDTAPRSVSNEYWERVCPQEDRYFLHTGEVKPSLSEADGLTVLRRWTEAIRNSSKRCVEVWPDKENDSFPQTFDLYLIGSHRLDSLWPVFRDSPTSRLLGPSDLVKSAIASNERLFSPRFRLSIINAIRGPFDRMVALHIRRTDYEKHCQSVTSWPAPYFHWNHLPELLDQLDHDSPPQQKYENHCYPSIETIKQRVHEVRRAYVANGTGRVLDTLFLATNADSGWISSFKAALSKGNWPTIVTSRDLALSDEQLGVGMAVDMQICRKAAVFVGNGYSSMTSNIIHSRLVDGREPLANRFW